MKRACYILTMVLLSLSALIMFFTEGISPFYGIFWITIFGGWYASIGLTALTAILLIVLITRSHFKNGGYKYVVLAIWIILLIVNIIHATWSISFVAISLISPISTVVLMVLSFLCAKNPEPTDEHRPTPKTIILKIALVVLAVILSIFSMLIFMLVFGGIEEVIESKIGMKKYIENGIQTPVSEEIANNFNSTNYGEIIGEWAVPDSKTALLPYGAADFAAYWTIKDDPRFVIKVIYDTWNGRTRETPMASNDFEYPNVLTDTVTGVVLTPWQYYWYDDNIFDNEECDELELTPEQAETLRTLAFSAYGENANSERIQLNNDDWEFTDYGTIKTKSVLWSYNDTDALYYVYGEIIKNKDGNYYICTDFNRYSFSDKLVCTYYEKIPDDIAEKIDAVFE